MFKEFCVALSLETMKNDPTVNMWSMLCNINSTNAILAHQYFSEILKWNCDEKQTKDLLQREKRPSRFIFDYNQKKFLPQYDMQELGLAILFASFENMNQKEAYSHFEMITLENPDLGIKCFRIVSGKISI